MQFRPYGDTGRVLSCLGIDISRNIKNQYQYNSILERAFNRGINYIQFDYRVFRKSIDLKAGLDKRAEGSIVDIGIVVPSNILIIKKTITKATKELGVSSIDFLIIQGKISDSILVTKFLTFLKKDNRVRHILFTVSDRNKDISSLESTESLDGVNFTGKSVLKALNRNYSFNAGKGTTVHNIYSGDKYKAENSIIFVAKALSISDIHMVTHRFLSAKEVDFVIDFIEKEEPNHHETLSDQDILDHVKDVHYFDILKGQKSLSKKIKSLFRKKKRIIDA